MSKSCRDPLVFLLSVLFSAAVRLGRHSLLQSVSMGQHLSLQAHLQQLIGAGFKVAVQACIKLVERVWRKQDLRQV